ncbi:maleylpyruvate isomerase family mycothiol-dependent enzyme [Streptomyces sp. F001]|uniref:maleylpyruvate isomerase family mycothiol-dependent enzyme n=1 Tax=Streptomyces sp. F001 TaxID=1510026 RepID=UPI001F0F0D77|nr:maleylpyruvate isomerase family mycothiol-dependent enzyme [Streptomyces sp. F001]
MTTADMHGDVRDPELPGRLLVVERDALIPLLRGRTDGDFATPTAACPGWTVRDVLAHCSAALMRVVESRFEKGVFSPEANDRDIAERADWTNEQVVDELERGMTEAGPAIAKAGGALDWSRSGNGCTPWTCASARGAGAYAGGGLSYALDLLVWITRNRGHVPLHADLDDVDEPLRFGEVSGERTPARYIGTATLVRLLRAAGGRRRGTSSGVGLRS